MATNDSSNVSTGKPQAGGAVFTGPAATPAPTNATTALNAAFINVGYCADSGVSNEVTTESSSIKAWGGDEVDSAQTSRTENFKFSMIETNVTALKTVYGEGNVEIDSSTQAIKVKHNGLDKVVASWVFEILLKGNRVKRIYVPRGKITSIDAISYTDGEPIKYGVTLAAFPNADGDTAIEYIASIA